MDWAIAETILQGIVPTAVSVSPPPAIRAVVPDVRKGIAAAGRIVLEHRIGAKRALSAESERAENLRRYTGIVFVIEGWPARAPSMASE